MREDEALMGTTLGGQFQAPFKYCNEMNNYGNLDLDIIIIASKFQNFGLS